MGDLVGHDAGQFGLVVGGEDQAGRNRPGGDVGDHAAGAARVPVPPVGDEMSQPTLAEPDEQKAYMVPPALPA